MKYEQRANVSRSERIYGLLLEFYPKPYKQEFGEEMKYVFSESLKDAYSENGAQGLITLWARTIIDAGKSLVTQHVENLKRGESMKTKNTNILMQNKDILGIALAIGLILLIPLISMQFSDEVTWTPFDFAAAGTLLVGAGLTYVLVSRRASTIMYRAAVGLAVATALFLVWTNLAVGIIGSEDNPANWMYIGVLAVGLIGALLARLQPHGMARALFATALAQMLVVVIALITGIQQTSGSSVFEILMVNAFFSVLWVGSALLFRLASATASKSA